jgi:DNA-binding transcriptional MocR family regulator
MDAAGLDVDELAPAAGVRAAAEDRARHPNYQNPAGVTLSEDRRRALLQLAAEYGFVIFEDDPYADIRFRGEPLPSMLSMDSDNVVVHASSFTKTVCPGVRVGYLVGPAALIGAIAKKATNLYISPGMVSEAIVPPVLRLRRHRPFDRTVRRALSERARVLAEAIRRHIPGATVHRTGRRLFPLGAICPRTSTWRSCFRWPRRRAWRWSRARTSCWTAAGTRCGWRSRR